MKIIAKKFYTNIYGQNVSDDNKIAYCHVDSHPGYLTANLIHKHKCLEKNCPFFQKFENKGYWVNREKQRKRAKKHRAANKELKNKKEFILERTRIHTADIKNLRILAVTHDNGLFIVTFAAPRGTKIPSDKIQLIKDECDARLWFKWLKKYPWKEVK